MLSILHGTGIVSLPRLQFWKPTVTNCMASVFVFPTITDWLLLCVQQEGTKRCPKGIRRAVFAFEMLLGNLPNWQLGVRCCSHLKLWGGATHTIINTTQISHNDQDYGVWPCRTLPTANISMRAYFGTADKGNHTIRPILSNYICNLLHCGQKVSARDILDSGSLQCISILTFPLNSGVLSHLSYILSSKSTWLGLNHYIHSWW